MCQQISNTGWEIRRGIVSGGGRAAALVRSVVVAGVGGSEMGDQAKGWLNSRFLTRQVRPCKWDRSWV